MRKKVSDEIRASDEESVVVFQSGGLVSNVRRHARLAGQSKDRYEADQIAIATILLAGAAQEAILLEYAYVIRPDLYSNSGFKRAGGVPAKYKRLKNRELKVALPDAAELWTHRVAIGHSEPDNPRSRFYGTRVNKAGVEWTVTTV